MPAVLRRNDFALDHLLRPTHTERSSTSDAARVNRENSKHWLGADSRGPITETTPATRKILRNRLRYEARNNSYFRGAIRTIVSDTVGTGPRLQLLTTNLKLNQDVQDLWQMWAIASDWALDCRVLVGVGELVGECFAVFRDSKRLVRLGLPVSLTWKLIEPDQVAHPGGRFLTFGRYGDDGIETDKDGEVTLYKILKAHPGDPFYAAFMTQADDVSPENVLQWFEPERPGQLRGNSPWEPAVPILNQLRRWASATLTAAEVASLLAGVMTQKNIPMEAEAYLGEMAKQENWFDTIELVRGMLLTLPPGSEVHQFKPEQPRTGYEVFHAAKLKEIGRCRNMPYGKIAGDHSMYNYSSARMDDAPYWADRDIQRQGLEAKVFNPFLYRWFEFAKFVIPALLQYDGAWWKVAHKWQYPAKPSSDPTADATADELNLTNATDTLSAIAERDGCTLGELLDARAKELAEFKKRGLPIPPWLAGASAPARNEKGRPTAQQPPQTKPAPEPQEAAYAA